MKIPIEDYALIGDRRSAALVSRSGSIDWLCWPRFDSDACFAALLGDARHGCWSIRPTGAVRETRRQYRPGTMILETRYETAGGAVRVTDLMPMQAGGAVIRQIRGEQGAIEMALELRLRFDYGSMVPWLGAEPRRVFAVVGPDLVTLLSDTDLQCADDRITAQFRVEAGEAVTFTLQYGLSYQPVPLPLDVRRCIAETERYWTTWLEGFSARPTMTGVLREAVERSLLILYALTHEETGGILAAPTLGLPEVPHGGANWDYRYTWLRDSSFALLAFLNAGFRGEAALWRDWLLRAAAGDPARIRTMYRLDGARHIETRRIDTRIDYGTDRPLVVGNAAAAQTQLDIYGEIMDMLHVAEHVGLEDDRPHDIQIEEGIVGHVAAIWQQPDQGIWETRARPWHFTYSKAMAWAAVDRFLKLRVARTLPPCRQAELQQLRDRIHAQVCANGFSKRRNTFVSAFDSNELDASLLLLPLIGFLPIDDPRIAATIDAVECELIEDRFVRRWHRGDGHQSEGAFIACTCWLADCRVMQGRLDEARSYLDRVLEIRNDVGLLAEEWDTRTGQMLGNFPQTLSHIALINTALRLTGPVLQR